MFHQRINHTQQHLGKMSRYENVAITKYLSDDTPLINQSIIKQHQVGKESKDELNMLFAISTEQRENMSISGSEI